MAPETKTTVSRRSKRIADRVSLAAPSPTTTERPAASTIAAELKTTTPPRRSRRVAQRVALGGVSPDWRDWAGLPWLVLEIIAGLLRDVDVADFLRFRFVCKLWMGGSGPEDPRALGAHVIDRRFHPRRWILLTEQPAEATPTRRKMLNVTTRKIINVDLPELAGHTVVPGPAATPEGMLVVRNEMSLAVRLLNPLTRHVVDLPTLHTLQPGSGGWGPIPYTFRMGHEVTAAGFADASTVVVYMGNINWMAVARPGDAQWTLVGGLDDPDFALTSTATFQGRFYCVDRASLLVVDLEHRPRPQLVFAANMEREFRTVSMVDDGGRLMAVCSQEELVRRFDSRGIRIGIVETHIQLFHVDLQEQRLLPVRDLGERAGFVGQRGAVLLPRTRYYFLVHRDTVYFRYRMSQRHFGAFEVSRRHTNYKAFPWGTYRLPSHVASYVTDVAGVY